MAVVNSRQQLVDYCLRNLGEPVLQVNVDQDQIEDKIDDALQKYQEFHSDATYRTYLAHQVTDSDMTNKYIPLSEEITFITKLFPISSTFGGRTGNMFDIQYQLFLNNMGDFVNWAGELSYLYQMEQYLQMIDLQINGTPQTTFSRRQNRLYIHGDFNDGDIRVGDYLVAEVYKIIDPETNTSIYNDMFIKEYTTALIKKQWGLNMMKFDGMLLPGGITINGRQMYDDAVAEIEQILEDLRLVYEEPHDFFIG